MMRTRLTALLIAAPLALAGCSGDGAPQQGTLRPAASQSTGLQPGAEVDKNQFLQETQDAMLEAKTYAMKMTMEAGGQQITATGHGDISDQKHPKADMTMSVPGSGQMRMILDGQAAYMAVPGVATKGKFIRMPLEAVSQQSGQDITKMMNPAESLKATQGAVRKIVYKGPEQQLGASLERYEVTLDPSAMQTAGPTAGPSMPSELTYDVWVDAEKRMRKMVMNVQGMNMTMTVDKFGEPVTIQAPPQASVTEMPGLASPTATG